MVTHSKESALTIQNQANEIAQSTQQVQNISANIDDNYHHLQQHVEDLAHSLLQTKAWSDDLLQRSESSITNLITSAPWPNPLPRLPAIPIY